MKLASTPGLAYFSCLAVAMLAFAPRALAQDAQTQPAPEPTLKPVTPPPLSDEDKKKLVVGEPETAAPEPTATVGIGVRMRYIFLPQSVLELFLGHATSLSSYAFGGEVIRRKGNLDIAFGVEYANLSPSDGLYLEKNRNPANSSDYPDFVHFDGFGMISVDGTFIWHTDLTPWMSFRYGAGVGIGFLVGDIDKQKATCGSTTTTGQLDDPSVCPVTPGTVVRKADYPPVVPIVNLLLGLRIKLHDEVSLNVEAGFRDVFFVGGGIGYFF
jgi:hypothetical protein